MAPLLQDSDVVEVQTFPYESLEPGHIIAYGKQNIVIHRVVSKNKFGLLTTGDSNILLDNLVMQNDYLGLATTRIRENEPPLNLLPSDNLHNFSVKPSPIVTYVPQPIIDLFPDWEEKFCNMRLNSLEETLENNLESIAGISPNGLQNETCLLTKLMQGKVKKFLCFGSFG
ncbi:MAG: hypothetical protein ACRDBG_09730, partial [Waterburya sp.]